MPVVILGLTAPPLPPGLFCVLYHLCALYTDKKENQIFLIFMKIQLEQLQSHIQLTAPHIWINICAFPHKVGRLSSYMTLQPIPYEEKKFFYQCSV